MYTGTLVPYPYHIGDVEGSLRYWYGSYTGNMNIKERKYMIFMKELKNSSDMCTTGDKSIIEFHGT